MIDLWRDGMHDHQLIACNFVAELLQKLVEGIVVALHERVGFGGEQVVEQPCPLKEIDHFVDISTMVKSAYGISDCCNTLE